jgi:hypothetical protein
MIENDMYDSFMNFTGFIFDVSYYMYQDYMDLKNQAASVYADSNNAAAEALINGSYQSEFLYINYDFTLKYVLPGIQEVTSEVPLHFYYD